MLRPLTFFDLALLAKKGRSVVDIVISTAVQNYNIWTVASASPNYIAGKTDINLTINNVIGSSTVGGNSLSVPNQFTTGDEITITNNSTVIGKGGNGGNGGLFINPIRSEGESVTGAAINAAYPVTIINNGTFAGGGGGGAGGAPRQPSPPVIYGGGGGGGGAGSPGGTGGSAGTPGSGLTSLIAGSPGNNGTVPAGGNGGAAGGPGATAGGPGGGQGADGTPTAGTPNSPGTFAGGTRGFYASGNPLITWQTTGTRLGRVS